MKLISLFATTGAAALLAACTTFPPDANPLASPEADLLAADEMARAGNYNGAEALLLSGRSTHPPHTAAWRSYTLKAADVAREAGRIERACALRFETNPGEVVHLPQDSAQLEPVGPRQRHLAEAVAAAGHGDHAGAAERLETLRGDLDPACPSWLAVTAAQMTAALKGGAIAEFLSLGQEIDDWFGDKRIVLSGEEDNPVFAVFVAYRAMAGKPLPFNTPAGMRDRLAFFAGATEGGTK